MRWMQAHISNWEEWRFFCVEPIAMITKFCCHWFRWTSLLRVIKANIIQQVLKSQNLQTGYYRHWEAIKIQSETDFLLNVCWRSHLSNNNFNKLSLRLHQLYNVRQLLIYFLKCNSGETLLCDSTTFFCYSFFVTFAIRQVTKKD